MTERHLYRLNSQFSTMADIASPMLPAESAADSTDPKPKVAGLRVNGKSWHAQKKAFRPTAGLTSYEKRKQADEAKKATKAREQEMKDEKENERKSRVQSIIDRRKAKEEKERYAKMAEKMHKKKVERRKKREKRNKLLNS